MYLRLQHTESDGVDENATFAPSNPLNVSKRVAGLEAAMQVRLFDRIGHRVLLTEAGAALLPRARRILLDVEDSQRAIANLSGRVEGRLYLGTSHHIGLHRLPPVLREFIDRYPGVRLEPRFLDSEAVCADVVAGELELGVVTLPVEPPPALALEPVWDDPLSVVVGREHALAGRARVEMAQLAATPAILPAPETFTRQIIESGFARRGLRIEAELSTNYLETIKMLVGVGLGWSLLPDSMLDEQLHALDVPGLAPHRRLGIVYHRERTLSNAARAMRETVTRHRGN